jgi:cytochrome P450
MLIQIILVVAAAGLFVQPILAYVRDAKHLRQFPSPSYAGISSLWRIFQNLHFRHYLAVHEAHQKLGTHVRIAPNHISISDPKAMNDIYGHGAGYLKDAWYDGGRGEYAHMADARVKTEHQAKRKKLAHVFAQKTIADMEPVITDTIAVLLTQIDKAIREGSTFNMRRYLNFFTIDVFSRLLYSESLECLERGNDIVTAETPNGKVYKAPFIKSLHDATIINTVLGMEAPLLPLTRKLFSWHPYKKAGTDYDNIVYHNTAKRLRNTDAEGDIFSSLLENNRGEPIGMPLGEILAEASVMMNAGTDTTTAALTNAVFLCYKHPKVLARLREELDANLGATETPTYDVVSQLPYLRACVEESLRFRPASSMGLPRVVPKGGRMIAGKFVSEDVTVSVPTYTLLRDPEAFDRPEEFNPERWLTGDKEKMSKAHLPFSTGPRACIGRNIAYFEQLLVMASLFKGYDFDFETADFELKTLERFNGNPDELVLTCYKRSVV